MRPTSAHRWAMVMLLAACASQVPANPKEAENAKPRLEGNHVRFVFECDRDTGATQGIVETSVRTLRQPGSGTVVVLLSMQHFALASYYRGMGEHLRDVDVVLAESTGGRHPGSVLPPDSQIPEEAVWLRRYYRAVARALGLQLQSAWQRTIVDDRWVMADMDEQHVIESMKAHHVVFLSDREKAFTMKLERLFASAPTQNDLAWAREQAESWLLRGPPVADHVGADELDGQREDTMWRIIRERLPSCAGKRVALVFGAWHMPFLEERLVDELGYRVEATCWHDSIVCEVPTDDDEKPIHRRSGGPTVLEDCARIVSYRTNDADRGHWIGQTSVRKFRQPESGASVVLLSLVHIGTPEYFQSLTPHLRDAEIVLAEGHGDGPCGKEMDEEVLPPGARVVVRGQRAVQQLLGLQSQLEWEAAVADCRWIAADLDSDEMVRVLRKHDFPLTAAAQAAVEQWEAALKGGSPAEVARARSEAQAAMLQGFQANDEPDESEQTFHEIREGIAWRALEERVASGNQKRVAVVFGAWHIPHIETRLVHELGYRLESACWHDCVVFGASEREED